ncbi:SDR family oxidoreductase [Novosphingobium capsulatum]|uniref:SDR family oxidoreductase n=1 Tax=Novosphingobium capsulatum TaxID=13688 RepID=UPI0012ED367D
MAAQRRQRRRPWHHAIFNQRSNGKQAGSVVSSAVAGPVLFFASPAAAFVTGQTLWVDGGVFPRAPWPYQQ